MRSWDKLQADEVRLLGKHFTKGRSGRKIDRVIIHHNAGNLSIKGIHDVWQTRQASAHYQVDSQGRIGQLVWDADTAWHAGNFDINARSIGIEHADISSNPWMVSDKCLEEGAHLTAAVCKYYKLGRPQWRKNVFPHSDFQSTACPASLSGSQHDAYMRRAQHWYDQMTGVKPAATPKPAKPKPAKPAKLAVDGSWGPLTTKALQYIFGTPQDGVVSSQHVVNKKFLPGAAGGWQWVTARAVGSRLIAALQKWVGATADGYMGTNTARAMQKWLGVTQDGYMGPLTVKALQRWINRKLGY